MAKKNAVDLKAAAAALLSDSAAANSIRPSKHRTLYEDMVDSSLRDASKTGDVITITLADGTTIEFREYTPSRPSDAGYHALITTGTTRPTEAQLTTGPDHRDSTDGEISGWPSRTTNAYLWFWASHTLSDIRNGQGTFNNFVDFEAAVRLTVASVSGYLYRSSDILYPAALNLDWRVS